jgi:hypothetical protein
MLRPITITIAFLTSSFVLLMSFLNGPLPLKGHKSRDLTTKSHVIAIDEEGFGDKFRQVPATRFFLLYLRKLLPSQTGSYIKNTKMSYNIKPNQ